VGNILNYESDTQTNKTEPVKYPSSQRPSEQPKLMNYAPGSGNYNMDGQST